MGPIDFSAVESLAGVNSPENIGELINSIVIILFPLTGILLLLYILYGGFTLMTSAGDPKRMEVAKKIISNGLVGFIIVFVSFWIVQAVATTLGIDAINTIFQ